MNELETISADIVARADPRQTLLETFLAGRNAQTLRAYSSDLADFSEWLHAPSIASAVGALIDAGAAGGNALALRYRASLLARELAPATINRRLAALRALLKVARMVGECNWSLEVENVRRQAYRETRGPGENVVQEILARLEADDTPKGRRNLAIVRLLYDLGLRRGEIVAIDRHDVDPTERLIRVRGKGRREDEALTLSTAAADALSRWLEHRGDHDGALFTNFDRNREGRLTGHSVLRIVAELGEEIGARVRPHGLRHTAVTEAVKAAQAEGMTIDEVMQFSRHRDVKTLMIYRDRERNVQGQLAEIISRKKP